MKGHILGSGTGEGRSRRSGCKRATQLQRIGRIFQLFRTAVRHDAALVQLHCFVDRCSELAIDINRERVAVVRNGAFEIGRSLLGKGNQALGLDFENATGREIVDRSYVFVELDRLPDADGDKHIVVQAV